jgi:outer membrane lipoprotein-sorting protein
MRFAGALMLLGLAALCGAQTAPSTQAAAIPEGVDAKLWGRMVEINNRSSQIQSLSADFEQKKFTAMLKRPLVSTGQVHVAGPAMRWDTQKPEPTVMLINEKEVQLLYVKQKMLEIYPVDQKLGSLAASPLPRLEVLKKYFTFKQVPVAELDKEIAEAGHLALAMTPIEASLKEHVEQVRVLLDEQHGYILRAEMIDTDGDRTVIAFSNISTSNDAAKTLEMDVPAGVKIVRPLDALQGNSDGQGKTK